MSTVLITLASILFVLGLLDWLTIPAVATKFWSTSSKTIKVLLPIDPLLTVTLNPDPVLRLSPINSKSFSAYPVPPSVTSISLSDIAPFPVIFTFAPVPEPVNDVTGTFNWLSPDILLPVFDTTLNLVLPRFIGPPVLNTFPVLVTVWPSTVTSWVILWPAS